MLRSAWPQSLPTQLLQCQRKCRHHHNLPLSTAAVWTCRPLPPLLLLLLHPLDASTSYRLIAPALRPAAVHMHHLLLLPDCCRPAASAQLQYLMPLLPLLLLPLLLLLLEAERLRLMQPCCCCCCKVASVDAITAAVAAAAVRC